VTIDLSRSGAQKIDQIGRSMEWVGDHPAVRQRQRREEPAVDFGE
jgi:hypothetical protein